MKRGAIDTESADLVALWVPRELLAALDRAVECEDTDRSKFIRNALRARLGILTNVDYPTRTVRARFGVRAPKEVS